MLMLLKLLKLFGLDVPAKIESGERGRDVRFEHAKDDFTRMAAVMAVGIALVQKLVGRFLRRPAPIRDKQNRWGRGWFRSIGPTNVC